MAKKTEKKKKTIGDHLLTLVLLIAIGVFCYAAFNLCHIYMEYKKGTDEYNQIEQMAVTERDPDAVVVEEQEEKRETMRPPIEVNFEELRSANTDVIGWIYVNALSDIINYPVVQGKDNDEYLHATYLRNYNFAGTIFVDYENSRDFSDCNTIVYGHNMKNGSMFGSLKKFVSEEERYQKSRYFWILTPEKNYLYEIFSAYTTAVDSKTYTLFKGPGTEFEEYLAWAKSNSEIRTEDMELTRMDHVVTLSTCTGNQATRFVVQGKLVKTMDAATGEVL